MNPIETLLDDYPLVILDGAFSTELERRGCDLNDPLWSAKVLLENPDQVSAVHQDYYDAGADCVITASYQATYEGFIRRGLTEQQAEDLITLSVTLARTAANASRIAQAHQDKKGRPLVAASVGPYGAYLADGSEYRGDYGLSEGELVQFHRKRLQTLISAGPDILACETIPCLIEAKALTTLLAEHPGTYCWISFSAKDGEHTNNGERLEECARFLDGFEQVAAVGINCTPPEYVESLIGEIKKGTGKPVIVYPNGGETYDGDAKRWVGKSSQTPFQEYAVRWYEQGARIIGGCCRTTPDDIRTIFEWSRTL